MVSFCLPYVYTFIVAAVCAVLPADRFGVDETASAQLVEYRKIWDAAPDNEFADLVRFQEQWFLVFREGKDRTAPGSDLRIMMSTDGQTWQSTALLTILGQDLREPKLQVTPDGRLMLNTVAWLRPAQSGVRHQSLVYFSDDGWKWEGPDKIGDPNVCIWRAAWHKGVCYGVGYHKLFRAEIGKKRGFLRLYRSDDGRKWDVVADDFLKGQEFPNEAALVFGADDTCYCLVGCSKSDQPGGSVPGVLGASAPPYTDWTWKDLGVGIGSPALTFLQDGRLLAASRVFGEQVDTRLSWVDIAAGRLEPFLTLPSNPFNGSPSVVEHDGVLWVSNHSNTEAAVKQRPSIYIGKVKLQKPDAERAAL